VSEWQDVSEWRPSYGDLFEEWEIAVARREVAQFQAKYPWLRGLDFSDLLQECLIHWYFNRSRFQEGKGASIKTYMAKVVRRRLQLVLREQLTDKRKAGHLAESLDKPVGEGEAALGDVIPAEEIPPQIFIRIDIESALEELTPLQRRICSLLSRDYSVKRVAEMLGKPRSTVRQEIKRITIIFSRKGLRDYWE
jgi:RNA polymerase sigma factor (sigma-70 family)